MPRRRIRTAAAATVAVLALALVIVITPNPVSARWRQVDVCVAPSASGGFEVTAKVPRSVANSLLRRTSSYPGVCASYGESTKLGNGTIRAFTQSRDGVPHTIGLSMTEDALDGLPSHPATEGRWCHDVNQDGETDPHTECTGGYEFPLQLSKEFRDEVDTPFQYVLTNWNPAGHLPEHIYDRPHFDVHFYLTSNEERMAIRPGPCGMLVDCEDFEVGRLPLPAQYLPADYSDFSAVEPGMGNHLIDLTGPEINGEPFTHTFIYGSYGGRLTFYEPMVTHDWFRSVVSGESAGGCFPIKQPQAWQTGGWYPTRYCVRHRENRSEVVTTLEDFVHRAAG
ncbi:hypothetical protein SAMN05443287_10838 [Micromonospora phaseoli]|uniref:DUF5602 domain-containing protein n=1 Tax=Micromonospora phaseoli TaxID=1144548 RepID=A0A1H7BUH3_9ACTN|nr:hypothetical protein [Micromonospora phaseoli]PZV92823.1 hypothetical protein CLV64_110246 [Micromonospora phaseoli]GIJ76521.1 hypothetical protein Xph01_09530 [Micromonospora phaseoli]SEJ81219.1 hypothetical protein SAMN05443287_10838 [Micromonospora phaseoli]